MRRALKAIVIAGTAALIWAPTQARADGYVSPWVAANTGANFSVGNLDNGSTSFGVNAGGMGAGIIGGELDFGFAPNFFGNTTDFGTNNVLDLMGNVIVGIPVGGTHGAGIRPFVTGGLGWIRRDIEGGALFVPFNTTTNDFGWNLGAGVMGFFSDHVGLRGDVKYMRTINSSDVSLSNPFDFSEGDFHFWRAGVGIVIR